MRAKIAGAAFLAVLTLGSMMASPPAQASVATETFVTMISDSGDSIGDGVNRFFYPGNAEIRLWGWRERVSISVKTETRGRYYSFYFEAPQGEILQVGESYEVQVAPVMGTSYPEMNVSGYGSGCNQPEGRFKIKAIDWNDGGFVTSLWVIYEQHCDHVVSSLIGEVRYNLPGDGGQATVGPRELRWKNADPATVMKVAPITLVNESLLPITFESPTIKGPDSSEFEVAENECEGTVLLLNGVCNIFVRYSPSTPGWKRATLHVPEFDGFDHKIPLKGFVYDGVTRFAVRGEPDDWFRGGKRHRFDPSTSTIWARGSAEGFKVVVESPEDDRWRAWFRAPMGDTLIPGFTYRNVEDGTYPAPSPGLAVIGNGNSCTGIDGEFTVHELEVEQNGSLKSVSVSFTQHCGVLGLRPLRGVLDFRASMAHPVPRHPWKLVHPRSVSLSVSNHSLAGRLASPESFNSCVTKSRVALQRKVDGHFETFARTTTDESGAYKKSIKRRLGLYRAIAPSFTANDGSKCKKATSPRKT